MATMTVKSLRKESYHDQEKKIWPSTGRHILAHYNDNTVVVYQAFCPEIADYAIEHGKFGGPKYNPTRMTWIKTNFLWMMYRSGWASKKNQERIMAIYLSKEGFDSILKASREGKAVPGSHDHGEGPDEVRLQWDPDHDPYGGKKDRRAIQLGLRGGILNQFHQQWIHHIEDITDFVKEQEVLVINKTLEKLIIPRERVYVPDDFYYMANFMRKGIFDTLEKVKILISNRVHDAVADQDHNSLTPVR